MTAAANLRWPPPTGVLLGDLGDPARADGAAAFADGEAQTLLHGDGLDQLDLHLGVVARHDHLGALGEGDDAGHVRRTEVELRAVVVEERRVPATLVLAQDVDLRLEVGVRRRRAWLDDDHAALDVLALGATEQQTDVLTGLALIEQLAEHLDAGDRGGLLLGADTDDVNGLVDLDDPALDAAGDHGAATSDREDVLDRHEERLLGVAHGLRDVGVHGLHELEQLRAPLGVALERLQRRDADDRKVVAGELVLREQLADLELDELEDLLVVDHVGLVQRDDDVGHLDLAGKEDVLARLRHRAVGGGDHEDHAVHLRGARDHVLDVVGVAGAVDVRVVALLRLVLDMRRVDGDAALPLLGSVVDLGEALRLSAAPLGEHVGDRGGQRRLPVVDVPDGADVEVRLRALELLLGHLFLPLSLIRTPSHPAR